MSHVGCWMLRVLFSEQEEDSLLACADAGGCGGAAQKRRAAEAEAGLAAVHVRRTPCRPRSWASPSRLELHSRRNARASLRRLGRPHASLAARAGWSQLAAQIVFVLTVIAWVGTGLSLSARPRPQCEGAAVGGAGYNVHAPRPRRPRRANIITLTAHDESLCCERNTPHLSVASSLRTAARPLYTIVDFTL